MQERHDLPLRRFSPGKASRVPVGRPRDVAPASLASRLDAYLEGAPPGLELPGRVAWRDPQAPWHSVDLEGHAAAPWWLAAYRVLLGRYGNDEVCIGFPQAALAQALGAPPVLRCTYLAEETSGACLCRQGDEMHAARQRILAGDGAFPDLAGRCAALVVDAEHGLGALGWLALILLPQGRARLACKGLPRQVLERMGRHLQRLLQGLSDEQARVGRLEWLDERERAELSAWRGDTCQAPPRGLLHRLFEAQARRTPQRIAVRAADGSLTYAELERSSAALAARLQAAGVGPERRVGVCLPRNSGLLVGLLGVLRAGGCYVPLDPAYPRERLAYMLDDADCLLVLVDEDTQARLDASGRRCEQLHARDAGAEAEPVDSGVGADNLAYIIYTSGSTGRPKGVAIEHGSAHAFLRWAGDAYGAEEWRGVLASTSVCFDLSIYELFGSLAWGGTLHLVDNLFSLADYPRRDEITLVNSVPSVCAALLALGDLPASVGTVNLAGEPLHGHLVQRLRRQPGLRRLVNLYGPTEDTTYSTLAQIPLDTADPGEPAIGRPLPGTTVDVLDRFGAPVPFGVAGELYLGGVGLARGYFGQPEQTRARFVCLPGGLQRLYRTGDRVRLREDGVLEHLGRLDDQVKFNGFRIELGEIATRLAAIPGVGEATAVLTEDGAGLRRLVAYLVAERSLTDAELSEHLARSLPHYMLPSLFMRLPALPKTLNGKIDRKALPRPQAQPQTSPTPGEDPWVGELREAWRAVLGAWPRPGQGFYAAGGDSLRAVHLLAQVRKRLGRVVPLAEFVGGQATLEALAQLARRAPQAEPAPATDTCPARLSLAEQRLWIAQQFDPSTTAYNLLAHLCLCPARLDAVRGALRQLLARHTVLRRCLEAGADGARPRLLPVDAVPLETHEAADAPGAETWRQRFIARESARPFDLASTAPVRLGVVARRDNDDVEVLLSVHHCAFDDVSLAIFARELKALLDGESLAPLACTPEQVAAWEAAALASGQPAEVARRWARDLLPALRMPRPGQPSSVGAPGHGRRLACGVAPHAYAASVELAARASTSLFSTALSAFAEVLGEALGVEDVLIGVALAGRQRAEVHEQVGCFVNLLPLALRLEPGQTPGQRLRMASQALLDRLAHQDVPQESVGAALREAGAAGLPIHVACGAHNGRVRHLGDPGCRVRADFIPTDSARLDLTLWLEDAQPGWTAVWTYADARLDEAWVRRLHQAWERRLLSNAGVSAGARA